MDPLHFCIALGPLAIYAFVLGFRNLSGRPFLTTGSRDFVTLGLAMIGLVIAGPMELFYPEVAREWYSRLMLPWHSKLAAPTENQWFGVIVWLLLIALYILTILWIALSGRPRLVLYNLGRTQLQSILDRLVPQLDPNAQWTGDAVRLPELGIHLSVELYGIMRCVQLVSVGHRQNLRGWRHLHSALHDQLRSVRSPRNLGAIVFLAFAVSAALLILSCLIDEPQHVRQALLDMLRM